MLLAAMQCTERRAAGGFTLLEALIALAIVGVALGASLRAVGILSANHIALEQRTLAIEAAQETLTRLRLDPSLVADGASSVCDQGRWALRCRQQVRATLNSRFRRVEIQVGLAQTPEITLARLTGWISAR